MSFDLYDLSIKMGNKCYIDKNFDEAVEHYSKAVLLAEVLNEKNLLFQARENLARSYYSQSNFSATLNHLDILIPSALGDDLIRVITLKGICYCMAGQFDQAISIFNSLKSSDSPLAHRKALINLGFIYLRRAQFLSTIDDLTIAIQHFEEVIKITDDPLILYKVNKNLGICFNLQGKFWESLHYFNIALQLANDNIHLISNTYHEMANSYIMLGEYSQAAMMLEYSLKLATEDNDAYKLGITYQQFGHLNFRQGNLTTGEEYFHKAIDSFLKTNSFAEISECFRSLRDYFKNIDPDKTYVYDQNYNHFFQKILEKNL